METWHILSITVFVMFVLVVIGALNNFYKNSNPKIASSTTTSSWTVFAISCMIAGILIYLHAGLVEYILLCFFIFIFFI
jgi:hypothetical protein